MSLSEDDLHKIAIYLFTHKWLAVSYSKTMEDLLVEEMTEALKPVNGKDDES